MAWIGLGAWAGAQTTAFHLSSPAFAPGKPLPAKYALAHENLSPELRLSGIPARTKSLALIVDDPDAPSGLFTHWVVWNLSPDTVKIAEGSLPIDAQQGRNSHGDAYYDGPSPPSGTHRYFFHLYALDTYLSVPAGAKRDRLEKAMQGHVVAETETMGTYAAGL